MSIKSFLANAGIAFVLCLFFIVDTSAQSTQARAICPGTKLTAAEEKALIDGHNAIRKELSLRDLIWDCTLAKAAQSWADRGIAEHDDDNPYGESIFVASSGTADVTGSLKRWQTEKANWTNETGTCAPGKICLHYTQIVWRTTAKLGCGINRNATGKWKTMLVCNYDPAGNTGGKAY
ncbi:MAG TPA: CAP domain-containing protein [Pyrinomonadaceae bacterium]|nr:CAP domain-containing protein [Pyrinomonadaceae bacterium]